MKCHSEIKAKKIEGIKEFFSNVMENMNPQIQEAKYNLLAYEISANVQ